MIINRLIQIASTSSASTVDESSNETASAIFSYEIGIDGHTYTIPCDYSEFAANGWEIDGEDGTINANTYIFGVHFKKGDKEIGVELINFGTDEIKYSEGLVGQVEAKVGDVGAIALPDNFTFDESTTVDDVIAKYGEPSDQYESDNSVTLYYQERAYHEIQIKICKADGELTPKDNVVQVNNFGDY